MSEFPTIVCGDLYRREDDGAILNVFGEATHQDSGEVLVIYATSADEVLALPARDFFSVQENGEFRFTKVEKKL